MRSLYSFLLILCIPVLSCKKDQDNFATGTVIEKKGCFGDSFLVAIDDPDPSKHKFLRATIQSCAACYNCSNAAFLHLSPPFTTTGTRIRFSFTGTETSCLSSSEAPEHITVKNIVKLQ